MSAHSEKSTWLILLLTCLPVLAAAAGAAPAVETAAAPAVEETQMELMPVNATAIEPKSNSTKDLFASETADPKKVEIVKQIRRLNEDGSYTVGYEAGDGTFKIESRDVQGNIKGTFGYVDGDGEIKRVSYSTSNATQAPLLLQLLHASRFNRTVTTTRKPQPTIVYPKSSSGSPTRATVIQAIPRRRPVSPSSHSNTITTTESYRVVAGNLFNKSVSTEAPKILKQFPIFTPRTSAETIKSVLLSEADEGKIVHQNGQQRMPMESNGTASTTNPSTIRSTIVYDKTKDNKLLRPNTFRRQLNPNNYENEQMFVFQQSAGDDTTDVYGGSILTGTSRPLFTTTTGKPRLVPFHSILAARQKLNEKLATNAPPVHEEQQETTLEATTNKINDGNYVTSNPIPIIQIPINNDNIEQRPYIKHIPVTQFRTREFLRDNPGAPVPIGNQRILFRYNPNIQADENAQFSRQPIVQNQIENQDQDKPNLISIPVQPISIPAGRYQNYNPYAQQVRIENAIPQVRNPQVDEFKPISVPVSTKDLKRLLQQLLVRQNRLQALMDIREDYRQPYNPQYVPQGPLFEPEYRQKPVYSGRSAYPQQFAESRPYNGYVRQVQFNPNYPYQTLYQNQQNQFPNRNDYRTAQDDGYRNNEINNFDPAIPYESQRFVPKRRVYRPRVYDPRYEETNMASETKEEQIEYLPPDVRESLLLKMLMLAIHPDFNPASIVAPMATTPPPAEFRKKVRNVQILGEENETKEQQMIPERA